MRGKKGEVKGGKKYAVGKSPVTVTEVKLCLERNERTPDRLNYPDFLMQEWSVSSSVLNKLPLHQPFDE